MSSYRREVFLRKLLVLACASSCAHAVTPLEPGTQPVAHLSQAASVPIIDGALDDDAWQLASPAYAFLQALPQPGTAPSQQTELKIACDGRTLFIAVRAHDSKTQNIVARTLQRDSESIESDDHIALALDPRGNGRNGFLFMVNALGAQRDALIFDGAQTLSDWDAVWYSAVQRDEEGWTAEMAIPLSVLNAQRSPVDWGFNVERVLPSRNETVRLHNASADKPVTSLADMGALNGIWSDGRELGLRLRPGMRLSSARQNDQQGGSNLDASLDAFYQVTPSLTAALTLNPDFADAQADDREVNLTRFELFRPEKRAFFNQDAGRFSFGGLDDDQLLLLPFFSRRIGLDTNGDARAVDAGIKLSGSLGALETGALAVRVAGPETTAEGRRSIANVGVLRAAAGVSEHQRVGMIAVSGNPEGTSGSRLIGTDYQYRTTTFAGNRTLETHGWVMETADAQLGTARAYGGRINFPNVGLVGNVSLQRIDADFRPALGFVDETGVERATGELGWWHRTAAGGDVIPQLDGSVRQRIDGSERSSLIDPQIYFSNAAGDFLYMDLYLEHEVLAASYELVPGLFVRDGEYRSRSVGLQGQTSQYRRWWLTGYLRDGDYYGGARHQQEVGLSWRPNEHFYMSASLDRNDIRLPDGRVIVQTRRLELVHADSIRSSQSFILQWDNVSRTLGVSLRARYLFDPGRELIFAYDQSSPAASFDSPADHVVTIKFVWNWQH